MLITHADARRAIAEVAAYRDHPALDTLSDYVDQQEARQDRKKRYFAGETYVLPDGERRLIVGISPDRRSVKFKTGDCCRTVLMKSFREWVNDRRAVRLGDESARPAEARGGAGRTVQGG